MDTYERNRQIATIREHRRLQWAALMGEGDREMSLPLLAAITTGDDADGQIGAASRTVSATLGRSTAEPHPLLAAAGLYLALAYGPEAVTATGTEVVAEVAPQPGAASRTLHASLTGGEGEEPYVRVSRIDSYDYDYEHCGECCEGSTGGDQSLGRTVEGVYEALHKSWLPRQKGQTK